MTLSKAIIQNLATGEKFEVMYNPTEYTSSTSMVTKRVSGTLQFQRLQSPSFTVNLFFDTYEQGTDVRNHTKRIAALQEPTVGKKDKREPPACLFIWGDFRYTGVIKELDQRFTMFLPTGIPVRAELTVTFQQVQTPVQANKSAGLGNCRKLHVVIEGERLDSIAAAELGDASAWPLIAAYNGLDDPLSFPTQRQIGSTLIIPDLDELPTAEADA